MCIDLSVCVCVCVCVCCVVRVCARVYTMEKGWSFVLQVYANVSGHMLLCASRNSFSCVASLHEF